MAIVLLVHDTSVLAAVATHAPLPVDPHTFLNPQGV